MSTWQGHSESGRICTKKVPAPCQNEATEILLARAPGGPLEEYPRCAEHPAADDVRVIRLMSPLAAVKIVPAKETPNG